MLTHINIEPIKCASIVTNPFIYADIDNCLSKRSVKQLIDTLPKDNYYHNVRKTGSDKTYDVHNNILKPLTEKNAYLHHIDLEPTWKQFLLDLQSKTYITLLSELINIDLSQCYQEITLKRYGKGHYISSHTDKQAVTATHLLFLNLDWQDDWGGRLCFLSDNQQVFKYISPHYNNSVLFIRSDCSWHSVETVVQSNVERISIQVAFWNTKQRVILPGRMQRMKRYD